MEKAKIFRTLLRPLSTEKTTVLQERNNQYAFEVARDANKIEIKKAIEQRFNVKVTSVRVMTVKGKKKVQFTKKGRTEGTRRSWKKAVVTLQKDDVLDFVEGA